MTPDQRRLERASARPAIVRYWRALKALRGTVTVLQTGAHPDDETSALLARFGLGDGARIAYACAVRGEGGQNSIGSERAAVLGVARTGEMLRAAEELDLALYWLNEDYDGAITDFGFSKSGEDTLARWGRDRLFERLVRVIRMVRPDIVLPTFLDVPGQHGHHRAVTIVTEEAFLAAGDPAVCPEHLAAGLEPWAPARFYLPAWSGAGTSYDDDEPPPPAHVTVEVGGYDAVHGATYAQLGQMSRGYHRTQAMGRWEEAGPRSVPLHCKHGLPEPHDHPFDGLPRTLAERAGGGLPGLAAADAAIDRALAAFPDGLAGAHALVEAIAALREARAGDAGGDAGAGHAALLAEKERQAASALLLAAGVVTRLDGPSAVTAGTTADFALGVFRGSEVGVALTGLRLDTPAGWQATWPSLPDAEIARGERREIGLAIAVAPDAPPIHPWRLSHDPLTETPPLAARLGLKLTVPNARPIEVEQVVRPEEPVWLRPAVELRLAETVMPLARGAAAAGIAVDLDLAAPPGTAVGAGPPPGWAAEPARLQGGEGAVTLRLTPAGMPGPGTVELAFRADDRPVGGGRLVAYDHIPAQLMVTPAVLRLGVVDTALPEGLRVAYAGGGGDHVGRRLAQLGLDVAELDDAAIAAGRYREHDSLLVGIMGFGNRPVLRQQAAAIRDWVEAGGTLVTLYHRPMDGWDPEVTPPRPLEVGVPSLRWRVTDPAAPVTVLDPAEPLLTAPNAIGLEDWQGWVKERGLYFAKRWDPAYRPVIEIADPGERPHRGALLVGDIGRGRHVHVALGLHTQVEALVPGAYRLLVNALTPRGDAARR
ncbi:MAG: PIG-L family deacetylase [Azospirillaceae bacterium]